MCARTASGLLGWRDVKVVQTWVASFLGGGQTSSTFCGGSGRRPMCRGSSVLRWAGPLGGTPWQRGMQKSFRRTQQSLRSPSVTAGGLLCLRKRQHQVMNRIAARSYRNVITTSRSKDDLVRRGAAIYGLPYIPPVAQFDESSVTGPRGFPVWIRYAHFFNFFLRDPLRQDSSIAGAERSGHYTPCICAELPARVRNRVSS